MNFGKLFNKLEKIIISYQRRGKKISGIIATDYAGHPCDWKSIKNIADKYNIRTVNDNCHAIGASINNNKKYAIKYADVVVHSYHPVKNITSGEVSVPNLDGRAALIST